MVRFTFLVAGLLLLQDDPFKRWERVIGEFEEKDRKNPPPKGGILFAGSSSIRKWKLDQSFPDLKTINRGFGGSEIVDSTHFADRIILPHKPRIVVLYAGDNDVFRGKSPEQVLEDYRAFVKKIYGALPKTRLLFLAIKPSFKRATLAESMGAANALIRKESEKDERLEFIDVATPMRKDDGTLRKDVFLEDGLHLNEKGYALWAKVLAPRLKKK